MTEWIAAIVIGFLVGALAKFIMPGRDPGGLVITTLLGIAGGVVGTYLGRAVGLYGPVDKANFLAALIGALIILGVYRLIRR